MLKIKIATKDIILSNRKQQYQKNVEVERAASRVRAKVNYKRNPQPKMLHVQHLKLTMQ